MPAENQLPVNDTQSQLKSSAPHESPRPRSLLEKVFGRMGPLFALAFTAMATLLRWASDGLLADHAPFSFYFLSVVLTALVSPMGSSFLAVVLGALCGHLLWVEPRFSLTFLDKSQVAQIVVYILVATLCALAVAAARVLRVSDYIDTPDN